MLTNAQAATEPAAVIAHIQDIYHSAINAMHLGHLGSQNVVRRPTTCAFNAGGHRLLEV